MYVGVTTVKPLTDYKLWLQFENGEEGVFDMSSYLETGIFTELQDKMLFASAHVSFDTVAWSNGADLCPETLYTHSIKLRQEPNTTQQAELWNSPLVKNS